MSNEAAFDDIAHSIVPIMLLVISIMGPVAYFIIRMVDATSCAQSVRHSERSRWQRFLASWEDLGISITFLAGLFLVMTSIVVGLSFGRGQVFVLWKSSLILLVGILSVGIASAAIIGYGLLIMRGLKWLRDRMLINAPVSKPVKTKGGFEELV